MKTYRNSHFILCLPVLVLVMAFAQGGFAPAAASDIDSTVESLKTKAIGSESGTPKGGIIYNCGAANIRLGADDESPVIGGVSEGAAVTILGQEGGYWKVRYRSAEGYVKADVVDTAPAKVDETEKTLSKRGVVRVDTSLNVRTGPWGDVIGSLHDGDAVEIVGKAGNWYKIKLNGRICYVYAQYVKIQDDSSSSNNSSSNSSNSNSSSPNPPTTGSGGEDWLKSFNKEATVSDAAYTDSKSMSQQQIQAFLEKKGSALAKKVDGQYPSEIIYNCAQKYGISPKVILATLQKEQGLVTKKSLTQKQLDWAMGCGAYDGGNWNQSFKGFAKQIDGGVKCMRKHYDDGRKKIQSGGTIAMTIDGESLHIKNAATYAQYKYTPHFAGNRLFRDVYKGFFGN